MAASIDPYPKPLDWLRYISAFLLLLYGSSKLLGRQFHVAPELAEAQDVLQVDPGVSAAVREVGDIER